MEAFLTLCWLLAWDCQESHLDVNHQLILVYHCSVFMMSVCVIENNNSTYCQLDVWTHGQANWRRGENCRTGHTSECLLIYNLTSRKHLNCQLSECQLKSMELLCLFMSQSKEAHLRDSSHREGSFILLWVVSSMHGYPFVLHRGQGSLILQQSACMCVVHIIFIQM